MRQLRVLTATALILCLYHLSLMQSMSAASIESASVRQQLADLGVGAKVKLKLAGGRKVRGSVQSLDDAGFLLGGPEGQGRHIPYHEVAQVKLAERAYRATGEPDPVEARRLVMSLGVGRHAAVKFNGRELHGHIQSIGPDAFTLLPDRETAPVRIAYSDVHYVEKNISFGATVVLVVLIVAGLVVGLTIAATR